MSRSKSGLGGEPVPGTVTGLLQAWKMGDPAAREAVVPLVYAELRRRAAAHLRRERNNHTFAPTALVHEVYVRLTDQKAVVWQNRGHFFGIAAQMMRRILVDYARTRLAKKRPRPALQVSLDEGIAGVAPRSCELLMLDDALDALAERDPRQAQIVELRYFGGLTETEIAELLSISRATVTREWQVARAWLYRRLTSGRTAPP